MGLRTKWIGLYIARNHLIFGQQTEEGCLLPEVISVQMKYYAYNYLIHAYLLVIPALLC
jgi:hypothetical protein